MKTFICQLKTEKYLKLPREWVRQVADATEFPNEEAAAAEGGLLGLPDLAIVTTSDELRLVQCSKLHKSDA
jgi:hypothetical protein